MAVPEAVRIQELETQLSLLQAQAERASSLEYALVQVQDRAQAADEHISYLQGESCRAAAVGQARK